MPDDEAASPGANAAADAGRTAWLLQYEPWLRLLARMEIDSRFCSKFDPSDVVQQTLLHAWQRWDQFRGDQQPQRLAWLRQILARELAQLARHYGNTQRRDVAREVSLEQSLCCSADRLDALVPVDSATPSSAAAGREQGLLVAGILEQLPPDYRLVIILRNLEDLPHEEVARRMNRSPGAVRMLWVRALTALRDAVEKSGAL